MKDIKKAGFICFGEVNTPYERLAMKHDRAVELLRHMDIELEDAGIVVDDPEYKTADAAGSKLESAKICCLIVCVAGWIPSHAVIRTVDRFRHIPMLLGSVRLDGERPYCDHSGSGRNHSAKTSF